MKKALNIRLVRFLVALVLVQFGVERLQAQNEIFPENHTAIELSIGATKDPAHYGPIAKLGFSTGPLTVAFGYASQYYPTESYYSRGTPSGVITVREHSVLPSRYPWMPLSSQPV